MGTDLLETMPETTWADDVLAERDTPDEAAATQAYRATVLAGERPAAADLIAALKTETNFNKDCELLRRRRAAAASLANEVPQAEREAADLEAKAKTEPTIGNSLVSAFPTVKELARALRGWEAVNTPGWVSEGKLAARTARSTAHAIKMEATRLLTTTADLEIDAEAAKLQEEIQAKQELIDKRPTAAGINGLLAAELAVVAELVEGKLPQRAKVYNDTRPVAELLKASRAECRRLRSIRAALPDVEKANKTDQARIDKLRKRLSELAAARLAPENMMWSE